MAADGVMRVIGAFFKVALSDGDNVACGGAFECYRLYYFV